MRRTAGLAAFGIILFSNAGTHGRSGYTSISYYTNAPLGVNLHALNGNKNLIHVTFGCFYSDPDVSRIQAALPWVTQYRLTLYRLYPHPL